MSYRGKVWVVILGLLACFWAVVLRLVLRCA
jgi:hypothetical protein